MRSDDLRRALTAEWIGTAFLVCGVVGSGIMAERLAQGNAAVALLANSLATGALLLTLIFTFGPISGAHLNPAVSLTAAIEGAFGWRRVVPYIVAQLTGAVAGVAAANRMFDLPLLQLSTHARWTMGQALGELIATFGLVLVIHGTGRRVTVVPLTVAAYITAAYWFTSSTSFANPAVTIARAFTNTFTGIRLADVLPFIAAQLIGALLGTLLFTKLLRDES
jgi:glycerol uptake facilitator-like aquaporin